ncbi:MAG: Stp1/IreP family PP2C-type Ser/Thr phosphatase [Anaerolineae bacterium]|nr:Stp1/IreP family PP2C-type Ser/Thr phosphatase [Anaerolineae bacterium]
MTLKLLAESKTDKGKVYSHNEDSVFKQIRPIINEHPFGLLIVADGIGGHKAGEVASSIVVNTIYEDFEAMLTNTSEEVSPNGLEDLEALEGRLVQAVQDANFAIYTYAHEHPNEAGNLGSTVTCALVVDDKAIIANVGDSRTYHLHDGHLTQITEDHSLVGEMVRKGIVEPDEIYSHPHRSVITRALGNDPEVEVDTFRVDLYPGDRLLLCSDGLWEMIQSETDIKELLTAHRDLSDASEKLVRKANEMGGCDNIGVVIGELSQV